MGCAPIKQVGYVASGKPTAISVKLVGHSGRYSIDNMAKTCTVSNLKEHINNLLFNSQEAFYELYHEDIIMEDDSKTVSDY